MDINTRPLNSMMGAPQGSVLGAVLFKFIQIKYILFKSNVNDIQVILFSRNIVIGVVESI